MEALSPRALGRLLTSTDHKQIAKMYLWSGLLFLAMGGALAMLMRYQLAFPGVAPRAGWGANGVITAARYPILFTMHGVIMVFFAITPLLLGTFGSHCIPLLIGARGMAFPRIHRAAFWVFALAQLTCLASFFPETSSASSGWTFYPPLSTGVGSPGAGPTMVLLALLLQGVATVLLATNLVCTVLFQRCPGMTLSRMPGTVWGLWLTSMLNLAFVPILAGAALLLLSDRLLHTRFFVAGGSQGASGDPLVYQHLFWLFGHPEVYILILPVWGFLTDFFAFFSRKRAFFFGGSVGSMIIVSVLSGLVYGHHMFTSGMSPMLGRAFMMLTLSIGLPAQLLVINWICTLWRGALRYPLPMLYALGTLLVFGAGGLTGLYLGTIATDLYLHDTMFVVGHFHLIMAAATFLGMFSALHYWFPSMFGKRLGERLGRWHFALSLVLLLVVFGGQIWAGVLGEQRRLYNPYEYPFLQGLLGLNRVVSWAAFALAAVQSLFVVNLFRSLTRPAVKEHNPWQVGTLDYTVADPSLAHNFHALPRVTRGPHAFAPPHLRVGGQQDYREQSEASLHLFMRDRI